MNQSSADSEQTHVPRFRRQASDDVSCLARSSLSALPVSTQGASVRTGASGHIRGLSLCGARELLGASVSIVPIAAPLRYRAWFGWQSAIDYYVLSALFSKARRVLRIFLPVI